MTKAPPPNSRLYQLRVCDGPSCGVTHESEKLIELTQAKIDADPELKGRVGVCNYTCFGRCEDGPNGFLHELANDDERYDDPDDDVLEEQRGFYPDLSPEKIERILAEHCKGGAPVEDLVDEY
ncbi:MAG: (2Fe-2S) ferredoxin domain-containing protein [Myxococcota bacterium]